MSEFIGPPVPEELLIDPQELLRERLANALQKAREEPPGPEPWINNEWANHVVSDIVPVSKHLVGASTADEFFANNFAHVLEDNDEAPGDTVTLPIQGEPISGPNYVAFMALYPSNALRSLSATDIRIEGMSLHARIDDPLAPLDPDGEMPDFDPDNPVTGFDATYAVFAVDCKYAYPDAEDLDE